MKVFDFYSAYYDLLYQGKDYGGEVDYIASLIQAHGSGSIHSILELGCGTGAHAYHLAQKGFKIHGIDLSDKMISEANNKKTGEYQKVSEQLEFKVGNVCQYRSGQSFDAVISLFHVMSYQTSNAQLNDAFATAADHLSEDGLFLFDFWYGPAVLTDLPHERTKALENDSISIVRKAVPVMHPNDNIVDVNYHCDVENKASGESNVIEETHRMRYLFHPELLELAQRNGFEVLASHNWMTTEPLSFSSWNGILVCQKTS